MATLAPTSTYSQFLISPRIPPELVLKTIQHLPFNDGSLITSIRHAHPRLRALFGNYERSITSSFMRKELRHAATDFKCADDGLNVDWLAGCVRSYDIIDDVMDALCSEHNFNAVLRHNVSLANAGLLLLYRLASMEKHTAKLEYVKSLQRDSLTAMYLVLHHATLSARYHGSGWIHQRTYGRFMDANQVELRSELEFCFAEAALTIGPEFISDTLLHHDISDAETTLLNFYHDHGIHDWYWRCSGKGELEPPRTQGPQREQGKERSLFTTLLERLSELMECRLEDVRPRVEQHLTATTHSTAHLSLGGKARLLEGLNVEQMGLNDFARSRSAFGYS